jgi:two-component system OmpR family sensor kinase
VTAAGLTTRDRLTGSFRRQLVVLSATVTAVAVLLLTLIVQLVLAQTSTRAVSRVMEERTDAVISSAQGASTGTVLQVPDASLDAGVAVYDAAGTLVAGNAPSALAREYAALSGSAERRTEDQGDTSRIRAQPFALTSGVSGVVVVTERLAPYEQAEHYAFLVSVVTGLLAVLASGGLAAWVSRRALAPVVEMASTADEWSEHDLGRRFDLGAPTNEITALAGTLDTLLDRVSAAIRSEQRLTSELAHELRTPLTAVQGTADLLALRPGLDAGVREEVDEIRAGTRRMADTITGLLELARSSSTLAAASVSDLSAVLREVTDGLVPGGGAGAGVVGPGVADRADLVVDVPGGVSLALPLTLAARAIAPVVENALRVGEHVTVSLVPARAGYVGIAVDDDGPGVAEQQRDRIFEPGHTSGDHAGSGLGLPLSRRIARSAGGDVRLVARDAGTRFVVELPRG